ncbi:MAG: ECF-type sigma factor [Pseudomonadota bacterium]
MTNITEVLQNWSHQSHDERGAVIASLYEELRRKASAHLQHEQDGHLQPTVLVNETYLRLVNISRIDLQGREHFFGLAGRIMREVLVDEARRRRSQKRNHSLQTRFTGDFAANEVPVADLLELDELLRGLEAIDPLYAQLFEARAFAGMTVDEAARLLDISTATVKRKWRVAVAWLQEHADTAS